MTRLGANFSPVVKLVLHWLAALLFAATIPPARADDFAARCEDRAAIESIYQRQRLGTQQSVAPALRAEQIAQLVRLEAHKEAVLQRVYGVALADAAVEAEVRRIETTTHAPRMLEEIKAALGHDAVRFARAVARPIVVERTLRARFENDDALHAPQRHAAEQARESLLAGKAVAGMHDVRWQLTPRTGDKESGVRSQESGVSAALSTLNSKPSTSSSGAYSVEATAQLTQTLAPPPGERDRRFHFTDLDPELQKVLRGQLQKPGDVSAVIETAGSFLLFLAKEKSAETLHAASLSIPKRSYEEWLAPQPGEKP